MEMEPEGDSKLGWCELGGSRLGWRELVGSRLPSAEHDAPHGGQTNATPGSRKLMELATLGWDEDSQRLQAETEGAW